MSIFYRILAAVIAICIPVMALFTALNIVLRMPDLYIYEFNSNQVANEIDLGMTDDDLGQFFSDFMIGKVNEFELVAEYRDREQNVFGTSEQINMENARKLLNITLYIVGGTFALNALCYGIFLLKKKKFELRIAYKAGIIVFTIMQAVIYIFYSIGKIRVWFYHYIFINPFGADDALPLMLTEKLAKMCLIADSFIALILIIILASVTWKMTKPRRMFWQ